MLTCSDECSKCGRRVRRSGAAMQRGTRHQTSPPNATLRLGGHVILPRSTFCNQTQPHTVEGIEEKSEISYHVVSSCVLASHLGSNVARALERCFAALVLRPRQ